MLAYCLISCNRIKRKGEAALDKTEQALQSTKETIAKKKKDFTDDLFNVYDSYHPDTELNLKRFKQHFGIDAGKDVKNLYGYGDFMGADYTVLLAFQCDTSTLRKIIETQKMTRVADQHDQGFANLASLQLTWWPADTITRIRPYKVGQESVYWHYLWYDSTKKQVYYKEYSL